MEREKLRIDDLAKKIRYHQDRYYNHSAEISDKDFDMLWDELKQLNPAHELFLRVGSDRDLRYQKRAHIIFMHSQDKVAQEEEFLQWAEKVSHPQFIVQYKLDGMSLELQYEEGHLQYGISRGDGKIGDDLSHNVRKLFAARLVLPEAFYGAVRGEVIMFRDLHREYYPTQANARNTVNGIMKRKDGQGMEHLRFYSYDAQFSDAMQHFSDESQKLEWLRRMGFLVVETKAFELAEEVIHYRRELMKRREALPLEIDGLVIKGLSIDHEDLTRVRPEKQVAFKFAPEEARTELCDIIWNESGHRYTPIAEFREVNLAGTTVRRASLVNPDFISAMNLAIGAEVIVTKRGDIIPRVEKVLHLPEASYVPLPPLFCNACGTKILNTGTAVYCPNVSCEKRDFHRIKKWIATLNIYHLGGKRLELLFTKKLVRSILDLYRLSEEKLLDLPRFGPLLAQNILKSLKETRVISFASFLAGFDIAGIGILTAQKLLAYGFDSLEKFNETSTDELSKVEGIGEVLANTFLSEFTLLQEDMRILLSDGFVEIASKKESAERVAGRSFCFTGSLQTMTRKEAEQRVRNAGGKVESTVHKDLHYLVTNDARSVSTKARRARELDIPRLDEEAFLGLLDVPQG